MSRDQAPERPACWTDTIRDGPAWSYDHGRSCENFGTKELAEKLLALIPGCSGCARGERAMQRWRGEEEGGAALSEKGGTTGAAGREHECQSAKRVVRPLYPRRRDECIGPILPVNRDSV